MRNGPRAVRTGSLEPRAPAAPGCSRCPTRSMPRPAHQVGSGAHPSLRRRSQPSSPHHARPPGDQGTRSAFGARQGCVRTGHLVEVSLSSDGQPMHRGSRRSVFRRWRARARRVARPGEDGPDGRRVRRRVGRGGRRDSDGHVPGSHRRPGLGEARSAAGRYLRDAIDHWRCIASRAVEVIALDTNVLRLNDLHWAGALSPAGHGRSRQVWPRTGGRP